MRIAFALAALLAAVAPAHAEVRDLLRASPVRTARSQLDRLSDALELFRLVTDASVEELLASELAKTPEGMLLTAYLHSNLPRAVILDLDATLGGGTASDEFLGELTATGTFRVAGDYCDLVSLSASVRGSSGTGDQDAAAGEARVSAGVCLWKGLYVGPGEIPDLPGSGSLFPLRLGAGMAVNTTPRFTARRNDPRRRFSELRVEVATEGLRYSPYRPETGVGFLYFDSMQRWEWRELFDGNRAYELAANFGFVRLFRTRAASAIQDRAIDIVDIDLHGTKFDEAVALIDIYPVRIRGLGMGSDHVLVDAELGVTSSGGTIGATNCLEGVGCTEETIETGENIADVTTWAARLDLGLGSRAKSAGGGFTRHMDSNILGQIAVENRATVWTRYAQAPLALQSEVFFGNATHYLDVDARGRERFAGASLDFQRWLGKSLWLGVQVDAILAYDRDAVLDGRVAGNGMRAFVTLGYHRELARTSIDLPPIPNPLAAPAPGSEDAAPAAVDASEN